MKDYIFSLIRTWTPIAAGQVAAWLALINIQLDGDSKLALSSFLGGVLSAVYYAVVRLIEQKWPGAGVLLGVAKSPDSYSKGQPITVDASVPDFAPTTPDHVVEGVTDETQSATVAF